METAFGEVGKFVDVASMFPDSYIGFKRPLNVIQIQDVEPHKLEWIRQSQVSLLQDAQPPVASDLLDTKERLAIIATFLDKVDTPLTEQERDMIEEHIVKGIAYRTVARKHGYTHGESVRQIVNRGLRKIRDYFEQRDNPHSFLNASIRHELDEPAHNHSK
jgi:DNA-directed RNA polymerase specialized sigma24 family protein